MTNKDLIALADALCIHNRTADARTEFTPDHLQVLAEFFASQDASFNRKCWMDYITGDFVEEQPIFVDGDRAFSAGGAAENKIVPLANRDEGGPKSSLSVFDRNKIVSFKPR